MSAGPKRVPAGTKKKHRFVAKAPRGTLTVTVKDGKGAAVSGAAVQVEQPGGRLLKGQTTAAGTVDFPSVVAGKSKVTVQKEGFKPGAATVQVAAAASVVANAVLQPATASLVVTVIDSEGTALAGADVGIETPAPAMLSQKTDAKGKATFKDLPVGTYQVSAKLDNYTGPAAAKAVQVAVKGKNSILVTLKPNPVVAEITPAHLVVVLRKHGCTPARRKLVLKTTGPAFTGTGSGTFTCSKTNLQFFKAAAGGAKIEFKNGDNVFTADALTKGVELFAEGATPSKALEDTKLTLALSVGTNKFGTPATAKATVVELTLELFQSRTTAARFPAAMGANAKIDTGRFIHVQDAGFHHGRAILVVREVKPSGFAQNLELKRLAGGSGALQLFPTEPHSAGEAATVLPAAFTPAQLSGAPQVAGSKGIALFVEGHTVSGGLRDVVLQLGIQGDEADGDRAVFTVVQISNLRAVVPVTPSRRAGAAARAHTPFVVGNPPAANDFSEDFALNRPLVLVSGSTPAGNLVNLAVDVLPAGVPISWSALRDRRPTPDGDARGVVSASPKPKPTVVGAGAAATLNTDAVGSFHVRAFVNNNSTTEFDRDPAAATSFAPDPFLLMNLVLVRVTLQSDASRVHQTLVATPGGGGIGVGSGSFNVAPLTRRPSTPLAEAASFDATVNLLGGGRDGRRGVDRVFGGWINNEAAPENIGGTFTDSTVAPPVNHRSFSVFATNRAAATGGTPGAPIFLPPPPPAGVGPAIAPCPPSLLDSGRGAAGTGGNSACLSTSGEHPRTNLKLGVRVRIDAVDSPGDGDGATHPGFPAARLTRFDFGLTFRNSFSFWTDNRPGAATGGPGNHPGLLLYSVLLRFDWAMRGAWSINPLTGAVAVITAPTVTNPGKSTTSPTAPAANTTVEIAPPTGVGVNGLLARDAQR